MNTVLEQIQKIGIIPVLVIEKVEDAEPLAKALIKGGLLAAEITFRTKAAEGAIKVMAEKFPELLLGAGTVLTTRQVDKAIEAGASFIVSPGTNPNVVKYCMEKKIPIIPGVNNPSAIEQVLELGIRVMKFFPAEQSGGLAMLKALAAPYVDVMFMPTGGIHKNNVKEYLAYNRVIACGGSWMVSGELIQSGGFDKITKMAEEAAGIVKEIRG